MSTASIDTRNRANAQHSTGPRTEEGKQRSSQNARKLGLFLSDANLEQEDPHALGEIIGGYTLEYCPRGMAEEELVRQISMATHRLRRLERIETALMHNDTVPHTRFEAASIMARQFMETPDLDRVRRARADAERSFHRAYRELEKRKNARLFYREPPAELQIEASLKHAPIATVNDATHSRPCDSTRGARVGQAVSPAVTEPDQPANDSKPGHPQNEPSAAPPGEPEKAA